MGMFLTHLYETMFACQRNNLTFEKSPKWDRFELVHAEINHVEWNLGFSVLEVFLTSTATPAAFLADGHTRAHGPARTHAHTPPSLEAPLWVWSEVDHQGWQPGFWLRGEWLSSAGWFQVLTFSRLQRIPAACCCCCCWWTKKGQSETAQGCSEQYLGDTFQHANCKSAKRCKNPKD